MLYHMIVTGFIMLQGRELSTKDGLLQGLLANLATGAEPGSVKSCAAGGTGAKHAPNQETRKNWEMKRMRRILAPP